MKLRSTFFQMTLVSFLKMWPSYTDWCSLYFNALLIKVPPEASVSFMKKTKRREISSVICIILLTEIMSQIM